MFRHALRCAGETAAATRQGRIRRNPGGPPSTHTITSYGGISFQPFGDRGYTPSFSFGLLVTTQALLLLDAILPPAASGVRRHALSLRLGRASPPTATTPMTELPGGTGYTLARGTARSLPRPGGRTELHCVCPGRTRPGGGRSTGVELWDPPGQGHPRVRWLFADWTGTPVTVAVGNSS